MFAVLKCCYPFQDGKMTTYMDIWKKHMVCCQAYQISIIKYRKQSYWGEKFETRQRIFKY